MDNLEENTINSGQPINDSSNLFTKFLTQGRLKVLNYFGRLICNRIILKVVFLVFYLICEYLFNLTIKSGLKISLNNRF